jgi:hypothetical protein
MWKELDYHWDMMGNQIDTLGSVSSYCVIGFMSLQPYVFSQKCIKVVKFTMQVAAAISCLLL